MEENKVEKKKLSYEELENIVNQLSMSNKQLREVLEASNQDNIIARITLLFKVLDFKDLFAEEFISEVVEEIEGLLRRPKNTKEN